MKPDIKVTKLNHSFNTTRILKDVSFEVNKGEFFIITGPNGSGKTTLMKLIAAVMGKKSGEIEISGKKLETYSGKELAVKTAFVPQLVSSDFPFTVREVVLSGRAPHQGILGLESKKDAAIVDETLEFTDIAHLAKRKIDMLSGGERQRAFIARAICQEPEIILLDEPTSALDMAHQIKVMDLMEKLKTEKKTTVVMISHDINLSAMYADTMLLLKEGKVTASGKPADVLKGNYLEEVYGCRLFIDENPFGNSPRIVPIPGKFR